MRQIVKHNLVPRRHFAGHKHLTVLPDHQRGGSCRIILRRHINPVIAFHARINFAFMHHLRGELAFRHARLQIGIWTECGNVIASAEGLAIDRVREVMRAAGGQRCFLVPDIRSRGARHLFERRFIDDQLRRLFRFDCPEKFGAFRQDRRTLPDIVRTQFLLKRFRGRRLREHGHCNQGK